VAGGVLARRRGWWEIGHWCFYEVRFLLVGGLNMVYFDNNVAIAI
jgi:hypothetical protein